MIMRDAVALGLVCAQRHALCIMHEYYYTTARVCLVIARSERDSTATAGDWLALLY